MEFRRLAATEGEHRPRILLWSLCMKNNNNNNNANFPTLHEYWAFTMESSQCCWIVHWNFTKNSNNNVNHRRHCKFALFIPTYPNGFDNFLAIIVDWDVDRNLLAMGPHLPVQPSLQDYLPYNYPLSALPPGLSSLQLSIISPASRIIFPTIIHYKPRLQDYLPYNYPLHYQTSL